MLTDFLAEHPEIVRDVATHTACPGPVKTIRSRRERFKALLGDLVSALEHGEPVERPHAFRFAVNGDGGDLRDREFLRHGIVEKLAASHVEPPGHELMLLSDWVWAAEHERLSALETQRTALLDLVPDAAAIVTLDGRILYVNRAATQLIHDLSGLIGEQIIGKTGEELGFFIEVGPSPSEFQAMARANAVSEVLVSGRWHELRVSELSGLDGRVAALGLTLTDIHERKIGLIRLELLTKVSRLVGTVDRNELWMALTQVPVPQLADWCAVSSIDGDGLGATFLAQRDPARTDLRNAIVDALATVQHHPLWRNPAASGFQLLSVVSDDLLRRFFANDEIYRLVAQIGIRSLMVVPVVSRGKPIALITFVYTEESGRRYRFDDPGVAVELALHASHIAENARLVEEAKASDARFRVALSEARTMVYEQDASFRYTWYYGEELPSSLVGQTQADVLGEQEAAELTALKQRVLDTGEPVSAEIELSYTGTRRWYRETIEAVRDRFGRRVGVIGATSDVTEWKLSRLALEAAVDLRDRVMGILGHDLRAPLSTMTLAAGALQGRQDLAEEVTRLATVISRAARRMGEMIETLLDFTRVRASGGSLPVTRTRVDLADSVSDFLEEARTAHRERTIELVVRGETTLVCDASRIVQALSNLVNNAASYGDPTKPIPITIVGDDATIVIEVHNDGQPIPAELLPVLFDPFVRGDTVSPHGLGLGLFVVREIVRAHDGTIEVTSTPETGTTFRIELPRFPRRDRRLH